MTVVRFQVEVRRMVEDSFWDCSLFLPLHHCDYNVKLIVMNKKSMDFIYTTEEGYNNMVEEIRRLEEIERPEVIQAIAEARDKGDLSENAEYSAAKEKQANLEAKIAQLRMQLLNVRILDTSKMSTDSVQILSKVTITDLKTKKQKVYTIVSDNESNSKEGKIAISTPIAKGLLGKKIGDEVEIEVPAGILSFRIDEIGV